VNERNDDRAIDWRRVKLVVFDVDGTLYRQRALRPRLAKDMLLHVIRHCNAEVPSVIRTYRQLRERLGAGAVAGFEAQLVGETPLPGRPRAIRRDQARREDHRYILRLPRARQDCRVGPRGGSVIRAAGVTPADTIMIGDRPERDGIAAQRAGTRCLIRSLRACPGWRTFTTYRSSIFTPLLDD
jgi:FMN phosphatase YigB (HAD superfamily)